MIIITDLNNATYLNGGGKYSDSINQVITLPEASDLYNIKQPTLRTAVNRDTIRGPFRKTDSTILLSHEALMRTYGKLEDDSRVSQLNLFYTDSNFDISIFHEVITNISERARRRIPEETSIIMLNEIIEYYHDDRKNEIKLIMRHPATSSIRNSARSLVSVLNRSKEFEIEYFKQS